VDHPASVSMWYAFTPAGTNRRDFRIAAGYPPGPQNVPWVEQVIQPVNATYIIQPPRAPTGQWVGYFAQIDFQGPASGMKFRFTTTVGVFPETFPYPDCFGPSCRGKLL